MNNPDNYADFEAAWVAAGASARTAPEGYRLRMKGRNTLTFSDRELSLLHTALGYAIRAGGRNNPTFDEFAPLRGRIIDALGGDGTEQHPYTNPKESA